MRFQIALLACIALGAVCPSQHAVAQVKHGPKWYFPDEKVHFFLPEDMRKQRIREDGVRVGHWKSKDKSIEVEAFVHEVKTPADRERKKWDEEFLRELDLELVTSEKYYSIDNEVWVVSARNQNDTTFNARQAVMVKGNKVFIVRGTAKESDASRTQRTGVSIRSLAIDLPGAAPPVRDVTSFNGLKGLKWTAPTGDFSIFIPKGFHSPKKPEPQVVKRWDSLYYAGSIVIIKDDLFQQDPFRNELTKKSFIDGFLSKFKGEVIEARSDKHNGRKVWKIRAKISQFGSDTNCHAWFYNGAKSSYGIVFCVAMVDEESEQVEEAVLQSIEFSHASDPDFFSPTRFGNAQDVIDDIARRANNKPLGNFNWDRIAGRFGGACLLFLIGYWIWSRAR